MQIFIARFLNSNDRQFCVNTIVAFLEDDLDEISFGGRGLAALRSTRHQDFSIFDHFCTSLSEELATLVISSED